MRLHEFAPQMANLLEAYTAPSSDDIFKSLMSLAKYNRGEFKSPAQKNFLFRAMGAGANDARAEFIKTDRHRFGEFGGAVREIQWAIYCDSTGVTLVTRESARGVETYWQRSQEYFDEFEQKEIQKRQRYAKHLEEVRQMWIDRRTEWVSKLRPQLVNNRQSIIDQLDIISKETKNLPPEMAKSLLDDITKKIDNFGNELDRLDYFYQRVDQLTKSGTDADLRQLDELYQKGSDYGRVWINDFASVESAYQRYYDLWKTTGQWWPIKDQPQRVSPGSDTAEPASTPPELKSEPTAGSNQFLGEIGKKLPPTDVTVDAVRSAYGPYGHSYGYVMRDTNGNTLMWWTTKEVFKQGDTAQITGTVKDHTVFNGVNQTVLKLVKKA